MKNKTICLLSSLFLMLPLSSCSQGYRQGVKVGFITDSSEITSPGLVKDSYDACQEWCNSNNVEFTYRKPNGNTNENRTISVKLMVENGCNVIVMAGGCFMDGLEAIANKYPTKKFIVIDCSMDDVLASRYSDYDYDPTNEKWDKELPSNLYCINYQKEIMGYALGYGCVLEGYSSVGVIAQTSSNSNKKYSYSFIRGINDACCAYQKEMNIKYVYSGLKKDEDSIIARLDTWFGQGMNALACIGGELYKQGATCASRKGINGKIITCGASYYDEIKASYGDVVLTSAINEYTSIVTDTMENILNKGENLGKMDTFGIKQKDDISNDYVRLETTNWGFKDFNLRDYQDIANMAYDGLLNISSSVKEMPSVNEEYVTLLDEGAL